MEYECSIQEKKEVAEKNFHDKVRNGLVKEVENLLKDGISARISFRGVSILHSTVEYNCWSNYSRQKNNYLKIAKLLVDYGADINKRDIHGRTPLQWALLNGDLDMVQVLLNKVIENKCEEKNEELFIENFIEQSQTVVDFLLKKGNSFKITKKEYPILLEFAAKNGDEKSFEKILMTLDDFEINYLNCVSGSTAFHTVIEKGTCKMIKDLVDHGAEINEKDEYGDTPLQSAIKLRRFLHVRCLLQCNASVFGFDDTGETALHLAARFRADEETIQMILSKGIDVDIKSYNTNETPLHLACEQDVETVKNFLNNGADINAKNFLGDSPLQKACAEGNFKVVSYLIKAGADVNCTNYKKRNALHSAILKRKEKNVIEFLLHEGIDVNGRDKNGKTALHYIGNNKSRDDLLLLKMLIKQGADINAKDNQGNTPLHEILKFPGFHNFIGYFLQLADVNAQNINGETPLSYVLQMYFSPFNLYYLTSNIQYLVAHLSKMIALKLHVCEKNLQSLNDKIVIDYYRQCNAEIYKLEKKIRNSNISILDFLWKDVYKLAAFIRNEEILETLDSYSFVKDFPIYGNLLETRIKKAIKRDFLLRGYVYIFNVRLKAKLPDLVINKIGGYLRKRDLNNFIEAFSLYKENNA